MTKKKPENSHQGDPQEPPAEFRLSIEQPLKALSIRQPYAGLIMAGIKNVENRSWMTRFTGPLAIVSTQKPDVAQWWDLMREKCRGLGVAFPEALCKINGAVLGVVDFRYVIYVADDGCFETDHPTLNEEAVKDWWNPDLVGFILENPRLLKSPIPISGRLGLYNLAPEIIQSMIDQLK